MPPTPQSEMKSNRLHSAKNNSIGMFPNKDSEELISEIYDLRKDTQIYSESLIDVKHKLLKIMSKTLKSFEAESQGLNPVNKDLDLT